MRHLVASLTLAIGAACLPLAAQSASVTIEFESGIDGVNDAGDHAYREGGFIFEKVGGSGYFSPVGGGGTHLILHNDDDYDWSPSFRLRAESGQLFDFIGFGLDGSWGIEGVPVLDLFASNGQTLYDFNAEPLDGRFTGVSWVDFSLHKYSEGGPPIFDPDHPGSGLTAITGIDSFELATVPIPAAVWLFGSALGLMCVVRRKAAA